MQKRHEKESYLNRNLSEWFDAFDYEIKMLDLKVILHENLNFIWFIFDEATL